MADATNTQSLNDAVSGLNSTSQLLEAAFKSNQKEQQLREQAAATAGKAINMEVGKLKGELTPPTVETRAYPEGQMPAEAITTDAADPNKLYLNLHKLMTPPKEELVPKAEAFRKFLPVIAAFAALGTIASRGNITVGIQALAGGLQGLMEGNRLKYEEAYNTWKSTTQAAIEDNKVRVQTMQDVLNDRRLTVAQKVALLKVQATELPAMLRAMGKEDDLGEAEKIIHTLDGATQAADKHYKATADKIKPAPSPNANDVSASLMFLVQVGQQNGAISKSAPQITATNGPPAMMQSLATMLASKARQLQQEAQKKGQTLDFDHAMRGAYTDMITNGQIDWNSLKQAMPSAWQP